MSRRAHMVGLLMGFAAWGIFWGGWGALLPEIKAASGASDGAFGLALLAIALGALPAMLATGAAIDRAGRRAVSLTLTCFAVAVALPAFAASTPLLFVLLLALGATSGALDVALNAGVAAFEAEHHERLFNKGHAAFPAGVILASPAIGFARESGLEAIYILLGMSALVLVAAAVNVNMNGRAIPTEQPMPVRARRAPRRLYLTRPLILLGGIGALVLLIENAIEQWSAIHLEETLGASPFTGSLGPGAYMAGLLAGRLVAQGFGEQWPERRIIGVTGLSAACGIVLAALATWPMLALLGYGLAGLGMAAGMPAILALAGRTVSAERRGAAIATITTTSYLGYLLSPPFFGGLAALASLRVAWLVMAGVGMALALAPLLLDRLGLRRLLPGAPPKKRQAGPV